MNKKLKRLTTFILIMAMIFTMAACGGDTTLAKIKDSEITQEQLDGYISYYSLLSLSTSKSELGEEELNYLTGVMLDFAVEVELLKQHYKDKGVTVLPDDYDDQFAEYKESLMSQSEDMQSQLSDAGISNDTLDFFFSAQYYTKQYMEDIRKEDPVTDKEIEDYYDEHEAELVSPAQIKVSHILVTDAEHSEAGKTSIEAIQTKLDDGESFADLAKEYSDDGSASEGGDLGWVDESVNYVQEFKDAAFALDKGETSDIVETEYGYHIIKVTGKKAEHKKTLKEAKEEIKTELESADYAAGIESLKNEIGVEYTDAGNKIVESAGGGTEEETSGDN